MDENRVAELRPLFSHCDLDAQRTSAGGRWVEQQWHYEQRGIIRSSQRDVDVNGSDDGRSLTAHGEPAAKWSRARGGWPKRRWHHQQFGALRSRQRDMD